jgi:YD repeat-containing protein
MTSQARRVSENLLPRLLVLSGLLISISFFVAPASRSAGSLGERNPDNARRLLMADSAAALLAEYHGATTTKYSVERARPGDQHGIREEIPARYLARYQQWKREFLSTETGQQQWAFYQNNPNFTLTLVVTRDNPEGGTTSNYKWNEEGKLIAATITLGCRLDDGFPNPVYFPVMNSLVPTETARKIDGETLAATKLAHEFGHVNRTAKGDAILYQLQSQLIPQYNDIFLSNGRDANDARLLELTKRMGGTPVEIWEDREYWGETNAMLYLRDRFSEDGIRCQLFSKIKRSVDLYAPGYEERFLNVAQSATTGRHCTW